MMYFSQKEQDEMKEEASTTPNEINREFAKLAGLYLHELAVDNGIHVCSCGRMFSIVLHALLHRDGNNLDFCADPRFVLEVMVMLMDWPEFLYEIGYYKTRTELIKMYFMDTTGLLALKGIEWLETQQGK